MVARGPVPSVGGAAGCDHVVYFYERDHEMIELVAAYLTAALRDGEAVVVIATSEHCRALTAAITACGADVEAAVTDGQLQLHDAAAILASFMLDDAPDASAFDATVGEIVRSAATGGRRVRAFGEIVALLWRSGRVDAAIEVEHLWNRLAGRTPLSLFCGYPETETSGDTAADAFSEVCRLHSDVVQGAPLPDVAEAARRFVCATASPGRARRFVEETLVGWDLVSFVPDSTLVVGELAANAVLHGRSMFTVALSRSGPGVELTVGDCSSAPPRRVPLSVDRTEGGRGLLLVDAIATRWGHRTVGTGKLIWAELGPAPSR